MKALSERMRQAVEAVRGTPHLRMYRAQSGSPESVSDVVQRKLRVQNSIEHNSSRWTAVS